MTPGDLPPPVAALAAAARHLLAGQQSPLSQLRPLHGEADHNGRTAPVMEPSTLTEYAFRHGMLAWASAPLTDGAPRTHMTRALQGVRLLQQLSRHLTAAGIDVVALKGPGFSQWLYGDPCARRFADLDLLVSMAQLDAAVQLLRELGFSMRLPGRRGELVYSRLGALTMVRADDHHVDLHWRLTAPRFPTVLDTADVLRDAIQVSLGGAAVRIPRPEHAAALALSHAAKHVWYALELPFSLAVLARRTDIDWNEVRALMLAAGAVRGAAAGLGIASDLFGVDVPSPFREDVRGSDVDRLRCCAALTLALPPGTFPDRGLERRIHRLSFDRTADRIRYDVCRVIEPTRADVEWAALPSAVTWGYWPLRVIRLGATVLGLTPADASE